MSDGTHKNTLCIARTLEKNYNLYVLTPYPVFLTLCSYSKYIKKSYKISKSSEEEYLKDLTRILASQKFDVFLPVGLKSYMVASKYADEIKKFTNVLVASWDKFRIAVDKNESTRLVKKLGIPVPKTYVVYDSRDLQDIERFPVVIKPTVESGIVKYANSPFELKSEFEKIKTKFKDKDYAIIVQEYIEGFGCGFFSVCKKGKPYAIFMHKRVKEFPITGGPSAVAESFFDKKLLDYGLAICRELKWTGPIMVEFKYSSEKDDFVLVEINPKLWGSLDLSVDAGVNIPEIIIKLALDEEIPPVTKYSYAKSKWLFPDEFKVLCSGGESLREFFERGENVYSNIDLKDPLPTFIQIARGLFEGFLLLVDQKRRYPHGKISKKV